MHSGMQTVVNNCVDIQIIVNEMKDNLKTKEKMTKQMKKAILAQAREEAEKTSCNMLDQMDSVGRPDSD